MAAELGFEEKVETLLAYKQRLLELEPQAADRALWYQPLEDPVIIGDSLTKALQRVDYAVGNHARREYGAQGLNFADKELREDTVGQRLQRSKLLATMTRPKSIEEINAGAEVISDFLKRILEGAEVEIAPFGKDQFRDRTQQVALEAGRDVFGVFDSWLRHRTLVIQYDTSNVSLMDHSRRALAVPLHRVVSGEGISIS